MLTALTITEKLDTRYKLNNLCAMGTQLNEQAYQKLIDENIAALNKHMPEHSLEKKHTIEVLKWSVQQIYHSGEAERQDESSGLHLADVSGSASAPNSELSMWMCPSCHFQTAAKKKPVKCKVCGYESD